MDVFDKIIRENCWKFNKGYPDSQEDINYLKLKINNLVLEQDEVDLDELRTNLLSLVNNISDAE